MNNDAIVFKMGLNLSGISLLFSIKAQKTACISST